MKQHTMWPGQATAFHELGCGKSVAIIFHHAASPSIVDYDVDVAGIGVKSILDQLYHHPIQMSDGDGRLHFRRHVRRQWFDRRFGGHDSSFTLPMRMDDDDAAAGAGRVDRDFCCVSCPKYFYHFAPANMASFRKSSALTH